MPNPSASSGRKGYKTPCREKFEIWSAVLEACLRTPRTQSWLMRKIGLNTAAAKDALRTLAKGQLLEQIKEPTAGVIGFKTSERGRVALTQYYQLITYFFEPKSKKPPKQYVVTALLANIASFIFGQTGFAHLPSIG